MEVDENNKEYVTLEYLKKNIGIAAANDQHDDKLTEIAKDSNSEIILKIKAYTETSPVLPGSEVFEEVRRVATIYARVLWFEALFQHEQAKNTKSRYKEAVMTLQESLKVEPTTRQSPIGIDRTNFEDERLIPYSQRGFGGREHFLS